MAIPRVRVKMPDSARVDETVRIRTLLMHRMETGLRTGADGEHIPRNIIHRFECRYDDVPVFSVELNPSVAANPYLEFFVVARRTGTLAFSWYEDGGEVYETRRRLTVSR